MHGTADFESRSECDLKRSGSWAYSLHPTTEILCLAFRLPTWPEEETEVWHPEICGSPEYCSDWDRLYEFMVWIVEGGLIEGHNSWFERGLWVNVMVPRYGWPAVPHRSWRCSAAKAAALALPRALELLCPVLGSSIEKDSAGHKLMMKMSKPRKPRKKELEEWLLYHDDAPMPTLWHETPEMLERLCDYCRVDVLAEEAASGVMPDLSEDETEVYLLDQLINERGLGLDTAAIDAALKLLDIAAVTMNGELRKLTGGVVQKATNKAKLKLWLAAHGTSLPDMQGATIDTALETPELHAPEAVRAMEIGRSLGRSSTKKYPVMKAWLCPDNRAHGTLLYHGAGTGRWAGKGIQPHNFPKGTIDGFDMDTAWQHIIAGHPELCGENDIMELLAQAIRGVITPAPGNQLYVADYAGIEARVLLWLAEDEEALDTFRTGTDIYLAMAEEIYGYPCPSKKSHPAERALGKVAVLGLGFQMGAAKFVDTAFKSPDKIVIGLDESKRVVAAYRAKFWRVKQMWDDQQAAAIEATRGRGKPIPCGRVEWLRDGRFLYCTLPSGRRLTYMDPLVKLKETPWGEKRDALSFMGVHPKNPKLWIRMPTYGGMIVENQTQAVARDIMVNGMLACEASGVYANALTVHDELVCEARLGTGSVSEFVRLLTALPDWAEGCPIEAEGWSGMRYKK